MTQNAAAPKPKRVPGRKPGPELLEEVLLFWGHVDAAGRKMILHVSRQVALDHGVGRAGTPLIITDRVF